MSATRSFAALSTALAVGLSAGNARGATLATHAEVRGVDLETADIRAIAPDGSMWRATPWSDLTRTTLAPGRYEIRVRFVSDRPGESLQVPSCAGRRAIRVDGNPVSGPPVAGAPAPAVLSVSQGQHELVLDLDVSRYERRVACGQPPRLGVAEDTTEGLGTLVFESPHASQGGGKAVVYLPPGRDLHAPGAVLVGLHPWNGSPWTYAAYDELLREARTRGVLLLMPSGLGNSLYTADAEDEVLRAVDALASVVRGSGPANGTPALTVSLWGASMGGAGATTIGFHHPDRFSAVTSFFGDSKYDLSTYVHSILRDPPAAHAVNALDVVDNARNLPVWLVHGEDDATSPIKQSAMLAAAMQQRGFAVRFDRVPGMGHAGALVARFISEVVAAAANARPVADPARVTYRSVRPSDDGAYRMRIERASPLGDAFFDAERRDDGIHVLHADGIRALSFSPGALGSSASNPPRLVVDDPSATVSVSWTRPAP